MSLRLHAFKDEPPFDLNFNYRSAVGKLNYLAQTTRPDIMYATHQVAKYSSDPRQSHGEAILYLVHYLKKTWDIGLKFTPDPTKGSECYCDSNFSGLWNKEFAPVDPSTAKSRSGWIIFYAGCPISWASKLQSQVALSTTEAKYIAMSQALRNVIPVMNLLQEMREREFQVICNEPYVYCKVLEDTSGALELTRLHKLRPRIKHIKVCYHHFCEHVRKGLIKYSLSTQKTRLLTYSPNLWHNMTFNVTFAPCAASNLPQATKVRGCYKYRVLWYLITVLTYQSHVTTL